MRKVVVFFTIFSFSSAVFASDFDSAIQCNGLVTRAATMAFLAERPSVSESEITVSASLPMTGDSFQMKRRTARFFVTVYPGEHSSLFEQPNGGAVASFDVVVDFGVTGCRILSLDVNKKLYE